MTTPLPEPAYSFVSPPTGETFHFRTSARGPSGRFAFQWRLAPRKAGPGPHVHPFESETFRVVSGRLVVVVEGVRHDLSAGDELTVPAGAVHSFEHPWDEEAVVEVSLDGPRMEDQFLPLAIRLGSELRLRDVAQMMAQFGVAVAAGASVPVPAWAAALMRGLGAFVGWFGVRPLPPEVGWERST